MAADLTPEVRVVCADYTSLPSFTTALQGQDAVVSAVSSAPVATRAQLLLADAAAAAGVHRFLPSKYGVNSQTLPVGDAAIGKLRGEKAVVVDHLRQRAAETCGFTWTGLQTGQSFDWTLPRGSSGIDLRARTVQVVDSGAEKCQASNLAHVARGVVAILQRPEETANQYLSTASFNVSQNDIIRIVEDLAGFPIERIALDPAALRRSGEPELGSGDRAGAWIDLVRAYYRADGAGRALREENCANDMLGLAWESLTNTIRGWLLDEGIPVAGPGEVQT